MMPIRESLFEAPRPSQDSRAPSSSSDRRPAGTRRSARRRFHPVVERPSPTTPRGFGLAILPLAGL
jgi:hypothetical protein